MINIPNLYKSGSVKEEINRLTVVMSRVQSTIDDVFNPSVVAHDASHLQRVAETSVLLASSEMCRNYSVLLPAAYLHDYHRLLEARTGSYVSPEMAQPELESYLHSIPELSRPEIEQICACVNFTEKYRCAGHSLDGPDVSIEAKIVRDADILDATGAVGIARAFMFGGFLGEPIWTENTIHRPFRRSWPRRSVPVRAWP